MPRHRFRGGLRAARSTPKGAGAPLAGESRRGGLNAQRLASTAWASATASVPNVELFLVSLVLLCKVLNLTIDVIFELLIALLKQLVLFH